MIKRYQVFISSTYQDLLEERLEVVKALLELDCIPCGMEYFPAANEDSWSYISKLIEQCDYYIVVVGGRYGSMDETGVSFTRREYEHALNSKVPTIAFIHSNPDGIPIGKTDRSEEGQKKLENFLELLRKKLCKQWSTTHELGAVVSRSVTQLIKQCPRTGWVPANQGSNTESTAEILRLTRHTIELEQELKNLKGENLPIDLGRLEDGNDEFPVEITQSVMEGKRNNYRVDNCVIDKLKSEICFSWDEIYAAVSPKISPVAADSAIRNTLNALVQAKFIPSYYDLKEGQFLEKPVITDGSFNIIRTQLLALGLVIVGKEQRGEKQTNVHLWRLTAKGEARMFQILARKKS